MSRIFDRLRRKEETPPPRFEDEYPEEAQMIAEAIKQGKGRTLFADRAESHKIGRNEPCPCGSGKKYKKCCI